MKLYTTINTTHELLFAANIAQKYYLNSFFKKYRILFIKMCKIMTLPDPLYEITTNMIYADVKQWLLSIYPLTATLNNNSLTLIDRIKLILNDIHNLPTCNCSKQILS